MDSARKKAQRPTVRAEPRKRRAHMRAHAHTRARTLTRAHRRAGPLRSTSSSSSLSLSCRRSPSSRATRSPVGRGAASMRTFRRRPRNRSQAAPTTTTMTTTLTCVTATWQPGGLQSREALLAHATSWRFSASKPCARCHLCRLVHSVSAAGPGLALLRPGSSAAARVRASMRLRLQPRLLRLQPRLLRRLQRSR